MVEQPVFTVREPTADEKALYESSQKLTADLEERSKAGLTAIAGQVASVASLFGFATLLPKEQTTLLVSSGFFWFAILALVVAFSAAYIGLWWPRQTTMPALTDVSAMQDFWRKRTEWRRLWQIVSLGALIIGTASFGYSAFSVHHSETRVSIALTPTPATDDASAKVLAKVTVAGIPSDEAVLLCVGDGGDGVVNTAELTSDGSYEVTGVVPASATSVTVGAWQSTESGDDEEPADADDSVSPNAGGDDADEGDGGDSDPGDAAGTCLPAKAEEPNVLAVATVAFEPANEPPAKAAATASVSLSVLPLGTGARGLVRARVDVAGVAEDKAVVICLQSGGGRELAQAVVHSDGVRRITSRIPAGVSKVEALAVEGSPEATGCDTSTGVLARASVTTS